MRALVSGRILSRLSVQSCSFRDQAGRNDRRGQDKSDGPVGDYAVVIAAFSSTLQPATSATRRAKSLSVREFLGTIALPTAT